MPAARSHPHRTNFGRYASLGKIPEKAAEKTVVISAYTAVSVGASADNDGGTKLADLTIDSDGLSAVATGNVDIADAHTTDTPAPPSGDQPSHTGVTAIRNAVATVRAAQADRIEWHSRKLQSASAVYSATDDHAASTLDRTV